jgi:hypothetical protein
MPDQTIRGANARGGGRPRRRRRLVPKPKLLVGIGTLLVGLAAVLALFVHSPQQDKVPAATTAIAGPSTTLAPAADVTTSTLDLAGSATSVQAVVPGGAEPATQYLADLEPISGGAPDSTPHDIRGMTYLHSISAQTGGCARNQKAAFVYNLGTHFRSLDAVVGLSDESTEAARVEVEVVADGASLFTAVVIVGHPRTVHVAVTGRLHVTLQQTYLGPNPNICSEAGDVVWGDARVTR